jgi:hypothetical protein
MVYNNNYCSIEDAWGSLVTPQKPEKKKKKKVRDPICELYDMSTSGNYNDLDIIRASNTMGYDRYNKSKYQKDRQAGRERDKYVSIDASSFDDHTPLYEQKASDDMSLEKQFESSAYGAQCSKSKIRMPDFESHFNPLSRSDEDEVVDREVEESEADYNEFKDLLKKKMHDSENDEDDEDYEVQHEKLQNSLKQKNNIEEQFIDDNLYNNRRQSMAYLDIILYIVSGIILIFLMEQFVKIGIILQG